MTSILKGAVMAAGFLLVPAWAGADIAITDAYARSSGPAAPVGAAFMVIENTSGTPDRLVSVSSDAAERVELHTSASDANGVMSMSPIDGGIEVPPHGRHALTRGGDHVMLMGLAAPLTQGHSITLTLTFEKAGAVSVDVPVDLSR